MCLSQIALVPDRGSNYGRLYRFFEVETNLKPACPIIATIINLSEMLSYYIII